MENQVENENPESGFVTPNYERAEFVQRLRLRQPKLKEGETFTKVVVKLLPPLATYKNNKANKYAFFREVHWGWKTVNPNNPTKPISLPFLSTAKKIKVGGKNQYVPGSDPALDLILAKEAELEAREKELEAAKADPVLDPKYQELKSYLKTHSLNKRWYLAAVDLDGKPTELELSSKTFFKLEEKINQIRNGAEATLGAMDPLDVNGGCWFEFTSTGNGVNKSDDISVFNQVEEIVLPNGAKQKVSIPKPGKLSKEVLAKVLKIMPDLSTPRAAKLTVDEIRELVSGNDDPERIAKIFKCDWTQSHQDDGGSVEDPDYNQ